MNNGRFISLKITIKQNQIAFQRARNVCITVEQDHITGNGAAFFNFQVTVKQNHVIADGFSCFNSGVFLEWRGREGRAYGNSH